MPDNATITILSKNINIYPSAYRGVASSTVTAGSTITHVYDPEARLNTETNLTRPYVSLADNNLGSFMITETYDDSKYLEFVIHGHYFKLSNLSEFNFDSNSTYYAHIKLKDLGDASDVQNIKYPATSLVTFANDNIQLDADDKFLGLVIDTTAPSLTDAGNNIYSLKILKNGQIPTESLIKYKAKDINASTSNPNLNISEIFEGKTIVANNARISTASITNASIASASINNLKVAAVTVSDYILPSSATTVIGTVVDPFKNVVTQNIFTNDATLSQIGQAYTDDSSAMTASKPFKSAYISDLNVYDNIKLGYSNNKKAKIQATVSTLNLNAGDSSDGSNLYVGINGTVMTVQGPSLSKYSGLNEIKSTINYVNENITNFSGTISKATINVGNVLLKAGNANNELEINNEGFRRTIGNSNERYCQFDLKIANNTELPYLSLTTHDEEEHDEEFNAEISSAGLKLNHESYGATITTIKSSLSYATLSIGNIDTTNAQITTATITNAQVTNAQVTKATITQLAASSLKVTRSTITNLNATSATIGNLTVNGSVTVSNLVNASGFNVTSDIRLKEDLSEYKYHDSILDLPIYKYKYRDTGRDSFGFIAQEVKRIYPEVVHDNDGYLCIEESKLVYLLMSEVKELKKEIEELKKKN